MGLLTLGRTTDGTTSNANANLNNNWTLLETLLNGLLDATNLAANAVTASKIAAGAVGSAALSGAINITTSLAEAGKRVFVAGGRTFTNVGTGAATVETDLQTVTIGANTLANTGGWMLRITAWGTTTGTANTKTIKLYFGATVLATILLPAAAIDSWRIDATVVGTSAFVQAATAFIHTSLGNAPAVMTRTIPAENMTGAVVVKTTGATPNAADEVTSNVLQLEWCKDTL